MAQSGPGKIYLFHDFFSEAPIADTASSRPFGDFLVAGQGSEGTDAGVVALDEGLSGVGQITSKAEVDHTTLVGTPVGFNVALMAPIIIEARVQFDIDLATKDTFFGLTDIDPDTLSIQAALLSNDGDHTLTFVATDVVGFYQSAELTETDDWHAVYTGGTTTAETDSEALDLGVNATAGEFQILRLEVDPNGTVRWLVDGVVKKTLVGAVTTSGNLGVVLGVESKGSNTETLAADYLMVKANRDWTV